MSPLSFLPIKERRLSTTADHPLALVTGASSGIGFELAKQFTDNGFDLIIAAEDDELATAKRDLGASGARVDAVQVDLATEAGVSELYRQLRSRATPAVVPAERSRQTPSWRMNWRSSTSTSARRSS